MSRGPLLERERELADLDRLVDDVAAGRGHTIVIEGQPGLGKSTLVAAVTDRARHRGTITVLEFCCGELEQELGWAAVVGLLGPALTDLSQTAREQLFAGPVRPAAALFDDPAQATTGMTDADGFGTVHALFRLLCELAGRRPILLVLDDAHWCDRESLQFLAYLQRRLDGLPVGLLVAMRPASSGAQPALLERLARSSDTQLHQLHSLGVGSVSALVRQEAFPEAGAGFCQTCWQLTAGNPFYLHELLIELREGRLELDASPEALSEVTPPTVMRSLVLRLDRLPSPGAAALARATSVLGDGATLRHAAALAELGNLEAVDALDALAAAELLGPGEPLRFVHPLVRTAIYSDIPAARRARQHARAADLLAADHFAPEVVALHLLHSPRAAASTTVQTLRLAASRAHARGAPQSAVSYMRRALEEPPSPADRAEVLVDLARAETAIGDPGAGSHLNEALELCADDHARAEILLALGWAEHHAGRFRAASDAFEQGLALSPEPPDPELSAQLEAGYLVSATIDSTRVTDARARIRVIEAEPPESQSPAHRELLAQLLFTRTMTGSPHHEIVELAQRIWAGGRLLDDGGADSQALWQVIGALSWADAYESSLQAIDLVLAAADRRGLALAHARARYARAWPNYWTGQLAAAAADARAAIEIWNGGLETYLPAAIYWLGRAELERGDAGAAARALTLAEPFERWAGTGMMPFIHALRGHLAADAGSPAEALVSHLECGREIVALLITNPTVMPWRSQAALAARLAGDERQAQALATEELELARVSGAPRAIGVALRAAGICTGGSRGIRLLHESVDVLGQSGATLEYGRAQIDLGAAIRRSGKRRDARPHLKSGLELTRAAGATVLARRAETELSAAGGRARQSSGAGPQTLTASERRVAELAAVGHTNRYIAGLLQISIKAVEWHLHQSYRKLDIDGRRQLPTALTG